MRPRVTNHRHVCPQVRGLILERTTGFEPATPTLARKGVWSVHRRSPRFSMAGQGK
jgi:hypothetical protein